MPHEVIMPALGMAQDTGVIVSWRKALGDAVAVGDPLFDVETDKTTMEIEAAHEGFLTEIHADAGADIPIGQTIAIITASGEVPTGTGVDLAPDTPKEPAAPIAPNPSAPPTPRDKPAAPSTPSAAPIAPVSHPISRSSISAEHGWSTTARRRGLATWPWSSPMEMKTRQSPRCIFAKRICHSSRHPIPERHRNPRKQTRIVAFVTSS
ncbi:MAG: biotin/lipoyl-containing protein, partial [Geminicoccaceae bacterium]